MTYLVSYSNANYHFLDGQLLVADLTCVSVSSGLFSALYGMTSVSGSNKWLLINGVDSCSQTPLNVGSSIFLSQSNGGFMRFTIDAITGGTGSPGAANWQDAIALQNASITQLQGQFSTLQTTIGSNGVDPQTIQASTTLFAALLVAGVTIYGLRSVWGLFREPGGHD